MKFVKYGVAVALLVVMIAAVSGCSRSTPVNVAATVNGKQISITEVDKQLSQLTASNPQAFTGTQGEQMKQTMRTRIMDNLIDMQLMLEEADKRSIKISDKELEAKIKELMDQYGVKDKKELEKVLKSQGMTYEFFKSELEKRTKIEKLGDELTKQLTAKESDMKAYYDKNKGEFATKDQIYVQHILVQKEAQAKEIVKELNKGADFAKLAKKYSIDPGSKDKGGELPWIDKSQYIKEFSDAAWALKVGQLTEVPVKTTYGFHVIKLLGKKPAKQRAYSEATKEIKDKLLMNQKRDIFAKWLEGARKKASIKKFLTVPTTDPETALPQGALEGAQQRTLQEVQKQQQEQQQQQGGTTQGGGTVQPQQ